MIPKNAKRVFSWIIFDVYQWEQELFDGSFTTFEMVKRLWTACVIPILDNWNILVSKQEQPWKNIYIDCLWWREDRRDSNLVETAKRELLEESWYIAKNFNLIISKNIWSSKFEWEINYYIATWLKKIQEQNLDAWEKLEVIEISQKDFFNLNFGKNLNIDSDFKKTILEIKKNKEVLNKYFLK